MEIEKRGCLRSSSSLAWACLVPSGQQMRVFRVGLGGSAPSISVWDFQENLKDHQTAMLVNTSEAHMYNDSCLFS